MKNIQMPESFLVTTLKLISALEYYELDKNTTELKNTLETQINGKIEAMKKREFYTQSKVAASSSEREAARQRYLNAAEIPEEYRYSYKKCSQCGIEYKEGEGAIMTGVPGVGEMDFCCGECAEDWNNNYLEEQEAEQDRMTAFGTKK